MNAITRVFNDAVSGNLTLMLDLDGATVYRQPGIHDPVAPEDKFEADLIRLMDSGCTVVINTGRPEKFVQNLFPKITAPNAKYPFWLVTETGARIRKPDQTMLFEKGVPNIENVRDQLKKAVDAYPGAMVEDHKMCAITVSLAAADDKRGAYSHMLTVCNDLAAATDGVDIIPVYKPDDAYIEIVPAHIHKGTAAEAVLDAGSLNTTTILCFGDSNADENMMVVTNDRGGYSFGVGTKAPEIAQIRLTDYKTSQELIGHLADLSTAKSTPDQVRAALPMNLTI